MLERVQLLRNIGQFDNVATGAQLPTLTKLSLVYAENGRGKTTIAAILRSASSGDPVHVIERHRLGSANPPHIVLVVNSSNRTFQNGAWSAPTQEIAVFDDAFVAANVCSGIDIEAGHRQNLHELILGTQGVALNAVLVGHVSAIEQHNRALRQHEGAISAAVRGSLTVEQFCLLREEANIDQKIADAERSLAAAQGAAAIRTRQAFRAISLPSIDVAALNGILGRTLSNIQHDAMAKVRNHLNRLGKSGEVWINEGMHLIPAASEGAPHEICPFCDQNLETSPVILHYQAYFGEAYEDLKTVITETGKGIAAAHHGDAQSAFERAIREAIENRTFWNAYTEIPEIVIDTAAIVRNWNAARDAVLGIFRHKFGAPLDQLRLTDEALEAIRVYEEDRISMATLSNSLTSHNGDIALVKERAAGSMIATVTADLNRLKLTKARHTDPTKTLCDAYLAEKAAKTSTEALRNQARLDLDNYRQNVFPAYQALINHFLQRFGASFRLNSVESVNTRAGSSCTYSVIINQVEVPLTSSTGASFRNTLSAGDRNTLALAFFFASLDQRADLAQAIVIIDDPMTSLDEHRSIATVQEIRLLQSRVAQIIVLSHFKPYLCELWQGADANDRSAIMIRREGQGSTLSTWDVRQDCITEHDKRHAMVANYVASGNPVHEREVAIALRPMLEAFLRVAYPDHFPPGTLLGPFITQCGRNLGTADEILNQPNINELRALKDYGNRFHHDTNPAWQTQAINAQELTNFSLRVLRFITKG